MPRQYKKRKQITKQQCPCCLLYFARLSTHYSLNQRCSQFVVNNDSSVLSSINELQQHNVNNNNSVNNTNEFPLNNETFDIHHINDQDIVLFDTINDENNIESEQNDELESIIDDNQHEDDDSNTYELDENIDKVNDTTENNNIQAGFTNESHHKFTRIQQTNDDEVPKTISNYYDMTKHQINVLKQQIYLPVDNSIIASIKLLKIMNDGHIASTHYKSIIEWFNETTNTTTLSDSTSTISLIKSKKKIISMLDNILYRELSPELSMKPIHDIIKLPSNHTSKISKINLIASLFSLLTDPQLMIQDNLLIYESEYLQPSQSNPTYISDIHQNPPLGCIHADC